jgi:hypothetical protein
MADSFKTIRRGAILATLLLSACASLVTATVTVSSVIRLDPFAPVREVEVTDGVRVGTLTPFPSRPPIRDPFRPPTRSPFIP